MSNATRSRAPDPGGTPIANAAPRHRQPWLPREDRTLRANAGIVPTGEIAVRLGRSRPAVLARARVLGLHWYRASHGQPHLGHTLADVAQLLGVDARIVRRWVAAGWLPADRREVRLGRTDTLWLVWDDDPARFLRASAAPSTSLGASVPRPGAPWSPRSRRSATPG